VSPPRPWPVGGARGVELPGRDRAEERGREVGSWRWGEASREEDHGEEESVGHTLSLARDRLHVWVTLVNFCGTGPLVQFVNFRGTHHLTNGQILMPCQQHDR
jgi:hypothetical protein